jgi:HEAT repeat protein
VPVLVEALSDEEPLIRGHAAWTFGAIAAKQDCPSGAFPEIRGAPLL